jgi:formaldehyde-activating enzyme involved in methanogenesis
MKSTFLLAVLISAVAAKAPTFIGFPKTLVCQNEDLTTFNVSGADVLVAVANGVSKANLLDPFGADDTSTAHCNNVAAPLYGVRILF